MNKSQFDELIHAPNRLMICASLASVSNMEFVLLKEHLDVSDSVLSKHLKVLNEAGYITLDKITKEGRPRTWLSLTEDGTRAFEAHVKALKKIVGE